MIGWTPRKAISWVMLASVSLAFAGLMMIVLLSQYERNFNATIDPSGDVYQLYTQILRPGQEPIAMAASLPDLAASIRASVPEARVARITLSLEPRTISIDGRPSLARLDEADASLADVLDLGGNSDLLRTTLAAPDGAVITRRAAQRLFSTSEAVGRSFELEGQPYRIGLVIGDAPQNSALAHADIFISSAGAWTTLGAAAQPGAPTMLSIGDSATLVRIPAGSGATLEAVNRVADRQAEILRQRLLAGQGAQAAALSFAHKPVPLRRPEAAQAIGSAPDPQQLDRAQLAVLFVLALTVLIAASLNASSLTMSQLLEVAPVIAVRRAFGASRGQVMRSAVGAGVAVFAIAAMAGCALAAALSGAFGSAMGRVVDPFPDIGALVVVAVLAAAIGFATTLYPAISASRFHTSSVLASRWANIPGASIIRVVLVALQVAASAGIILFAAVVYQQLSFLTEADLGFDPSRPVAFKLAEPIVPDDPRSSTLRGLASSADQAVSLTAVLPSGGSLRQAEVQVGKGPAVEASAGSIDSGYFKVLGVTPLAGRFFEARDMVVHEPGPPRPVIISANLAAALGFDSPPTAVGQLARLPGKGEVLSIVGVAPDLPVGAIRAERKPFAIYEPGTRPAKFLIARSEEIAPKLAAIFPDHPMESISMSERVRSAYVDLERVRWLAGLFAILALATASVGIYALAVNRAAAMRIEASVRKAFGAESGSIVLLLIKRLTPAILFGVTIGLTVGVTLAAGWLNGFARQEASVLLAGLIAIAAVGIVFVVVSAAQALKLARSKPVDILRE